MAITDATQIISVKENYIKQYVVGLFAGGISAVAEAGGIWTLTISYDQVNSVSSSFPTLAVGDPITVYDSLTYPTGVVFKQYAITAINSLTEITITTSDTITTAYSWRLFAGHNQTANPRALTVLDDPREPKTDAPIAVVQGIKNIYNEVDRTSACIQRFLIMLDMICTVELFQADEKWSAAAVADCKEFCDSKAVIAKQNIDFHSIKEDLTGRFDHYMQSKESYGNKVFFEIDNNRLIRP